MRAAFFVLILLFWGCDRLHEPPKDEEGLSVASMQHVLEEPQSFEMKRQKVVPNSIKETSEIGWVKLEDHKMFAEHILPSRKIPVIGEAKKIKFGTGGIPSIKFKKLGSPTIKNIVPEVAPAKALHKEVHRNITYKELGVAQGLNSSFVSSIYKDSRGYFWLGSRRGVSKFDGFNFEYYPFAEDAEHRLVGGICEDASGNIWFSFSAHGGLMMFDGINFYDYQPGSGVDLDEQYLGILGADSYGNIWLKGHTTIIKMKDGELTVFPYQFQNLTNLNIILKEGQNGEVWFSALGGVCSFKNGEMFYHPIEEYASSNLCHPIWIVEEDVLISTGEGVTLLARDTLTIYKSDFVAGNVIRNCLSIGKDFVLSSENKNNAFCYFKGDEIQIVWEPGPVFSGSRPFFVDEQRNVWLSEFGQGVMSYNPYGLKHFKFDKIKDGGPVSAMLEDNEGNIWFGMHGAGLVKFDGTYYYPIPLPDVSHNCIVRSLCFDSKGVLWIGTVNDGCLSLTTDSINPTSYQIKNYDLFGQSYSVYALGEDDDGRMLVGTQEHGLIAINHFDEVEVINFEKEGASEMIYDIRGIHRVKDGSVWVASQSSGLYVLEDGKISHYTTGSGLKSDRIVSLFEDDKGHIWLGYQDSGIDRINDRAVINMGEEEGLTSNAVWSINADNDGNIWLGADNTLNAVFNGVNLEEEGTLQIKSFANIGGTEGGEFFSGSTLKDKDGNLWWGTDQMVTKVEHPESYLSLVIPQIQLGEVKLINNHVDFIELKNIKEDQKRKLIGVEEGYDVSEVAFEDVMPFTNCPTELRLPAEFNDLTFEYEVLNQTEVDEVYFSYYVPGIDKTWSEPSLQHVISYHAIPAGQYVIYARSSLVKGVWSDPIAYEFEIYPIWYQTVWARVIWGLLALGLVIGVLLFFRRRRIERESAEKDRELMAFKGKLYSNVTHEFRTPLTLIMGLTDQIKGNEKERKAILENSGKLLRHVNQLLDIAKNESGLQSLSLIQGNIVDILKLNVSYFNTLADEKDISLTFYSEEEMVLMDFDEEKIQHIVYNLMSNAIKFTPVSGKIVFHVSVAELSEGRHLVIKVKDSGVGIASENLSKIFDRFYQVESRQQVRGTGIGLSLTKDFISLMNGTIDVKSEEGKGTTFEIRLPITNVAILLDDTAVVVDAMTDLDQDQPITTSEGRDQVLIIEDHIEIAQFLADILSKNYQVHVAHNGAEGVSKALELIPDAIISDVAMPEMNGYEVCEMLKTTELTSHIPIVLLTAKVQHEDKMTGLLKGADAYLTKPFKKDELELRVAKLIESRKMLRSKYAGWDEKIQPLEEPVADPEAQFLVKLRLQLEEHLGDSEFGVPQLSMSMNMSQMQLYRKLKALVDQTPSQFIRSYRLQRAKELLKTPDLTISEVAYSVGFSDPNYFSRMFHKEFGNPPSAFRN